MTETVYDFDTDPAHNATAERFPASGTFTEFNDRMRALMAAQARFLADGGGASPLAMSSVVNVITAEDGTLTLEEPVSAPLPTGFLLTFRLAVSSTHPLLVAVHGFKNAPWLYVGGAAHPLKAPGGATFANFALRQESIYQAVFDGAAWQLLSNPFIANGYDYASPGAAIGADHPIYAFEATDGLVSIEAKHIGSTLYLTRDPANTGGSLAFTIPAKLTDRWPVGSWIDVFQFNHKNVTIAFDNPRETVVELGAVGNGGAVSAGTLLNNVVYFRLARLTTGAIDFLPHTRGVR